MQAMRHWWAGFVGLALGWTAIGTDAAQTFTAATYNLDNYLDTARGDRPAKSPASRAKIREGLRVLNADVLALQELGGTNALLELRGALRTEGLVYPYWELVAGADTNLLVAVLSKFPLVARRPHTRENYLLHGRRFYVSRGFAEVDVQVNPRYTFTLITAHLKSRRLVPEADEAELREQEARLLRTIIQARLTAQPRLNLMVLGDFNDTKESRSLRGLMGRKPAELIDTRPAEPNGDNQPNPIPYFAPRNITWTYYYGKTDTYSRIDYLLVSREMAREWDRKGTAVLALPNWGLASDHRPIIARFWAEDR